MISAYFAYIGRIIADQKRTLQIVVALFVSGIVLGAFDPDLFAAYIQGTIKNLFEQFEGLQGIRLFVRIFFHNLTTSVVATASGIFFGIFPLISSFTNGLIIGAVMAGLSAYAEISVFVAILSLTPHGIFEIPAFLLALALGLSLGAWPLNKEKTAYLAATVSKVAKAFLTIILPFLIVAAAIETIGIELLR